MMLDGTKIKWQQDQSIKRIQSMMHYTSQDELCRSNVIITYFDEKIIENCGKCDVCIKREMYKNPTKLKAQLLDKLKQKHPEGFQLRQALDSISKIHETLLIEIIRTQCDDFLLIKNGEWYTWKK
jgi:superfamily II DNA helicase RecQ